MSDTFLNIVILVFLATFICFCYLVGDSDGRQDVRTEAVERGFAEWVKGKRGKDSFRWKEVAK